jgi:hypothetical protein
LVAEKNFIVWLSRLIQKPVLIEGQKFNKIQLGPMVLEKNVKNVYKVLMFFSIFFDKFLGKNSGRWRVFYVVLPLTPLTP